MKRGYARIAVVIVLGGVAAACSASTSTSTKAQGTEGGSCYPNRTCNSGLSCFSSICVNDGPAGSSSGSSSGGGASSSSSSSSSGGSDGGGVTGKMGGPCNAGDTCDPGLTCVAPGLVGGSTERYCAPPCTSATDCQVFDQTSYHISVPDTYAPFFSGQSPMPTNWWSSGDAGGVATLSRGVACASIDGSPNAPKYCLFGCGKFMAIQPNTTTCYCLPGYSLTADRTACNFGTAPLVSATGRTWTGHPCSIFSYGSDLQRKTLLEKYGIQTQGVKCDACNSDTSSTDGLGCHSNQFLCDMKTTALNGVCVEVLFDAQFQQCVAQKTDFSCDCPATCVDLCAAADGPACYGGCCACSRASAALPAPTCAADAGTTAIEAGGAAAGDGG